MEENPYYILHVVLGGKIFDEIFHFLLFFALTQIYCIFQICPSKKTCVSDLFFFLSRGKKKKKVN